MFPKVGVEMFATRRLCCAATLLGIFFCATASAAFNFVTQTRSVWGSCGGYFGSDSETITSPGFGLFDATTSVTVPTYGGGANQHQHSELLSDKILYSGSASVYRPAMVGTGIAEATTSIDVTFHISTATQIALEASGNAFGFGTAPQTISLTGPATNINWSIFDSGLFPAVSGSRSTTALLQPGDYRFRSGFYSTNTNYPSNNFGISSFNITLSEVPEPGCLALLAIVPTLAIRRRC